MEYDQMRAMEKTHVCAQCGGELVTIWDAENSANRLCCGRDHSHNGFKQKLSPGKALQRGEADKALGPGAQKDLEERAKRTMLAFGNLPKQDAGDFSLVTLEKVNLVIKWAESVGLSAFLGHVELYYGEPRVSIDGYYYLNNKREKPYRIGTNPMNITERGEYSLEEGDYGFIARAYIGEEYFRASGFGIVKFHELTEMSKKDTTKKRYPIVSEHPQRMAEKRAEWQLLRKLISLEEKDG